MSFFQKPLGATLLLGTALGTPYVLYETEQGTQIRRAVSFDPAIEDQTSEAPSIANADVANSYSANAVPEATAWSGAKVSTKDGPMVIAQPPIDLRQVIRFDISPDFVYRSFPRVSTVLSDLNFDGLRVPLVSGAQAYDVAGSLTYYFDRTKQVRRIQFQGVTGDEIPLVQLMVQHYRLTPERSLGGQLLTTRWNNSVTSFMHVAPAPVVSAQMPNARFAFFLELNQPSDRYALSQQASEMLMQAQAAQRW